ncbi:MAG: GtrA family protein [Candidatus Falkowbacteria bacterium]
MGGFLKIIKIAKEKFQPACPTFFAFMVRYPAVFKFIVAGIFAGGTDLILLFLFHGIFNIGIVTATSMAFMISFVVSFSLQKYWTFNSKEKNRLHVQLALYLSIAFVNLNINGWGMHVLVNYYKVWYLLAQVIVSGLIGFESFLIYKFIIFRNRKK